MTSKMFYLILVYMEVAQERVIEFDVPAYYAAPPAPAFSAGTALQIEAQTHRTDLNGKYAVAIGRDGMRSLVMTATGDMLSVSDAHLVPAELAEGTRVTVVGLQGELERHNGQTGLITVTGSNGVSVQLGDSTVQIEPINVVITPEGSDEVIVTTTNQPGKRRRLIASLAAAAADFGQLSGAPTLLGGPVGGAASRLMAIDAAVAMSSAQPILKRCGTLRKLVHGFPGFAPLAVCIVAKLHADPSHPARVMEAADASEAMRIASALTEGKMDGVPRKDLATVLSDSTTLEAVLRLADRYCGANHLVFAIDTNFAGVRETIVQMVHGITAGHSAPEPVVPDIPMEEVIGDTPIILPFNNALASRYAPKKQEDDN